MKPSTEPRLLSFVRKAGWFALPVLMMLLAGCKSPSYDMPPGGTAKAGEAGPLVLREGDVLTITFPGAATVTGGNSLNTVQHIGRDGKISLPVLNIEVVALGKTVGELKKDILQAYGDKLQSKQIEINVQSSSYSVYITGAVLRPGKITTDRTISALQAVMDVGVDHTRANLKAVKVTRVINGRTDHYKLNLKQLLEGGQGQPFYLEPGDIVYVPEKFTWL